MIRTIYSSICGALILVAAMTPAAILIMDKTGFQGGKGCCPLFTCRVPVRQDPLEKMK